MLRYAACFFAALICCSPVVAKGPYGSINVGNWQGGAYTNDATGAFSHCAAGTPYASGIYFMVFVDAQYGWALGFMNPSWQLKQGEAIPVELTFDGRGQFHVFGTALQKNLVQVLMPGSSALISQFRRAYTMTAFARGQAFSFNLTTTSQLLPALANCVAVNAGAKANIGATTNTEGTATASAKVSSPRSGEDSVAAPELQMEAIQLATNFILKTGLHNPKVLSPSETPVQFASFGAAWKSDEAAGAVKIVAPDPNLKGIDVAAAIAGQMRRHAKGSSLPVE